jgi:hypothetical protein
MIALGSLVAGWRAKVRIGTAKRDHRSRCLTVAICLSALAFPVVSASDDLYALSPEAEESSSISCGVRKSTLTVSQTSGNDAPQILEMVRRCSVNSDFESTERISENHTVRPEQALAKIMACRAPPPLESLCLGCASNNCVISQLGLCTATLANRRVESSGDRRIQMRGLTGQWSLRWLIHSLTRSRFRPTVLGDLVIISDRTSEVFRGREGL